MIELINYITSDCWWDTDKTILPQLCSQYKLNVFSFDGACGTLKYPEKEDYGFKSFYNERQRYRDRNIREICESWKWFKMIYRCSKKDNCINFIIPYKNPYLSVFYLLFLSARNTIICFHNYKEHSDNKYSLSGIIKKMLYARFKYFHFYSCYQQSLFENEYQGKVSFVTNMPLKDFGRGIEKRFSKKTTFLFFGSIREYKRIDIFIKAANKVDAFFVIAGHCEREKWTKLEQMINNKSKFKTDICFIDDKDVASYFTGVDYLVLPYSDMTQSGPSLIAINYGVPIIASDVGAFVTMIDDGKNGFLFKHGCVDSLVEKMELATSLDEIQYRDMRKAQNNYKMKYAELCDPIGSMKSFESKYSDI